MAVFCKVRLYIFQELGFKNLKNTNELTILFEKSHKGIWNNIIVS